jgi:Flp pilus assembly protein TadB
MLFRLCWLILSTAVLISPLLSVASTAPVVVNASYITSPQLVVNQTAEPPQALALEPTERTPPSAAPLMSGVSRYSSGKQSRQILDQAGIQRHASAVRGLNGQLKARKLEQTRPMIDLIALFVVAALLILVFLLLGFILAHFLEFLVFLLALLAILTVLVLLGVIQVTRRI